MSDKHAGGRPPLFETEEQLIQKIEAYFTLCDPEPLTTTDEEGNKIAVFDKKGNPVIVQKVPTTSGLAHSLGYASRQSLYDLKNKDKFSYTIKRAILLIEDFHEGKLGEGNMCTGSIFWLKNHDWRDKQEISHTVDKTVIDELRSKYENK